jgi:hypothetical protein
MKDFNETAEHYIAMWNETDAVARRALVDELWAEDARYVDPMVEVTGRAEIDATVAAVQRQFTGLEFRLVGDVDAHHQQARFGWELGPAGHEALVVGFDVAERDAAGRLTQVLGFLDKVPG